MKRMKMMVLILALVMLSVSFGAQAQTTAPLAQALNHPVDPVFASWQPFTGGVMMWWSDTDQIWVMLNNGTMTVYSDIWAQGMPNPAVTAPSGYFTPVMGFGAIWQALGGGNSSLGWAMSEHVGYDTAARRASGSEMVIQGPGNTVYAVTLPQNANSGLWRVISYG